MTGMKSPAFALMRRECNKRHPGTIDGYFANNARISRSSSQVEVAVLVPTPEARAD